MQNDNLKNKRLAILFWILTVICFGIIFYFSNQSANLSANQSGILLELFRRIFGENAFSDFIIRKCAHFLEYVGTCLIINFAFIFTKGKKQIIQSIACASIYAITDEVHQIFIDGRSCEFRDWFIDTCGAMVGTILFVIIFLVICRIMTNSKKEKRNQGE